MSAQRQRVDTLIAERGLAPSRTAAARSVRAGRVRVGPDGPVLVRPSELVPTDADIVVEQSEPFVSRGGTKLANALDSLPALEVTGRRCLDVGASTGGFTDCLLQRGASQVISLDVGHGQLDWRLRNDERVSVVEHFNARELEPGLFDYLPELIVVDVSFISVRKLIAPIARSAEQEFDLLVMVKPQFELGPKRVGRGGVVGDRQDRIEAVLEVGKAIEDLGLVVMGVAPSGLTGPKGNRETFIWANRGSRGARIESRDLRLAIEAVEV